MLIASSGVESKMPMAPAVSDQLLLLTAMCGFLIPTKISWHQEAFPLRPTISSAPVNCQSPMVFPVVMHGCES